MAYQDELNREAAELQDEPEKDNQNATDSTETAPEETQTPEILPEEETDTQAEVLAEAVRKAVASEENSVNEAECAEAEAAAESTENTPAEAEQSEECETQEQTGEANPADEAPLDVEPDEELLDVSADEEIEFEVETDTPKTARIAGKVRQVRSGIQEKYTEARTACKNMMERISGDMEQTNYNPYIRSTTTYRYEILRKSSDTEPVDVFEFERSSGFSLRAMAITSVLVAAADIAIAKLLKKKLF